jgi:TP901 family phage tail tape measure protein
MSSAGGIRAGKSYVELGLKDKIQKGLDAPEKKLKAFGAAAVSVGKGLMAAGAAVSAPLTAAAAAYAEVGAALEHASAKTGASVEALSTLGYAAQQSGVDMEGLEKGMTKMQKTLAQARSGSKQAQESFSALGINIADLKDLSPDEQFKAIADKLAQVEDPANRASAAMAIFGKSGADLLPLLDHGGSGIEQMQDRARALGLEMSGESAKGATSLKRAMADLGDVGKMLTVTIGQAVAPAVQQFAQRATRIIGIILQWSKSHQELIATIRKVAVGVTAAGAALAGLGLAISAMAPAVGAIGAVVAALAAPVAAVAIGVIGIGAAFAYAIGSGDTFAGRIMSGLGKVADFLDTALGSWDGFTTSMAELWQQLKPRLENVWLDLKGSIIGIWDELKETFPNVVYGWGGALAEFAVKAWNVIRDLAAKISNVWQHAQDAVVDAVGDEIAKREFAEDPNGKAKYQQYLDMVGKIRADRDAHIDAETRKRLDANQAGRNHSIQDIEDWKKNGLAMTPEQHAAEAERNRAEIEAEKQKNNEQADKDWADYLAKKAGLPKLSDAIHKALAGAKDFFDKGPELPAIPEVQKAAGDGVDGVAKKLGAVGTFNARAAGMLAGGTGERIAKATEDTAKYSKKTLQRLEDLTPLSFS